MKVELMWLNLQYQELEDSNCHLLVIESYQQLLTCKWLLIMLLICIGSSEIDSDILSGLDILSDEGTEDEGIGRNVRKHQGADIDIQTEGKKETICTQQVIESVYISFQLWY